MGDTSQKEARKEQRRRESERQDLKSHCQNILQGIRNSYNNSGKRAIWELVQNTRDLSENSIIRIRLTSDSLFFSHNGKPFEHESLTALIKQVSSADKESAEKAGQFGTGFMTTHKFSRVVRISGPVKVWDNEFTELKDFELDRSPEDVEDMINLMSYQLKIVEELFDTAETKPTHSEWTTFEYRLNDDKYRQTAIDAIHAAENLMPYAMVINRHIHRVEIKNEIEGTESWFECSGIEKQSDNLYVAEILSNKGENQIKILCDSEDDPSDIIILPLDNENNAISFEGIPKLFVHFPLLGSESLGFNFIYHSKRFYPTEPRDSIDLPCDNRDLEERYAHNVDVLNSMDEMLFKYLQSKVQNIKNARNLSAISIDPEKHSDDIIAYDFFKSLKHKWVSNFVTLPLLKVDSQYFAPNDSARVRFLSSDIVDFLTTSEGQNYYDTIYELASKVSCLPEKSECLRWSEIVYQWDPEAADRFVTVENIVDIIVASEGSERLHEFLKFLVDIKQGEYFKTKPLLPNREGLRRKSGELRTAPELCDDLYRLANALIPSEMASIVDRGFEDVISLPEYTRIDLKKGVNEFLSKEIDNLSDDQIHSLIDYCSAFPVESGSSYRNLAMPYIAQLWEHDYKERYIAPVGKAEDEQDLYRTAFNSLLRRSFRLIESKDDEWVKGNSDLLLSILKSLSSPDKGKMSEYQQDYFTRFKIFPNRNWRLCKKDDLKLLPAMNPAYNEDVESLLEIYKEVLGAEYRDCLLDNRFSDTCVFNVIEPKKLALDIDEKLKPNYENPITVKIIELLDTVGENNWRIWFDNIERDKANIFIKRLNDTQRKLTYKFMKTDPANMAAVSEILDAPNLSEIIQKAKTVIAEEYHKNCQFEHLHAIGKHVEDVLRARINSDLFKVEFMDTANNRHLEADDIQNGQDMIVYYNEKPIFFIEVKSKWDFNRPGHMSVNQMRKAVVEKDRYALCCVELSEYRVQGSYELMALTEAQILENTYVHLDIGTKL